MLKVGLVGEDPNDTLSVKLLLQKRYNASVRFCQLVKGIRGFQLDNPKVKRALKVEVADQNCNFVVYIRDLDGFGSEVAKVKVKTKWFEALNAETGNNNLFLLNIWELEALILGDVETFNTIYDVKHAFSGNPEMVKEPKEVLMNVTRKGKKSYKESHCPDIFAQLDITKVEAKCATFKSFLEEFDAKVKA